MQFTKLTPEETQKLRRALDANVLEGKALHMDPIDTSFVLDDRQIEEDLIATIKSVPTHY